MANTSISQGARNDTPEGILRKHLSPALKGAGWDSLISAIATGDAYVKETATSAFDQLFKSTASGIYLDRIAANDGFTRPPGIGISDDVFRKLAIKTTARKQVVQVILETLEAYYGSDATRAFSISSVEEPYALVDGDQLLIKIDNEPVVTVTFQVDDFQQISSGKAIEVVARINRAFKLNNSTGYAVSFKDPSQNKTFVKIFSGSLGLSGAVSIHGGKAQNILKFPTPVHPISTDGPQPGTQFNILGGTGINGVSSGRVRFTYTGGSDPDLIEVRIGDYANIFGSIFSSTLRGSYKVVDVSTTTVEFESNDLSWPSSVTITSIDDIKFFRPTVSNIQSTGRMATVVQGDPSVLEVLLPATTEAVSRSKNTGAYLHVAPSITVVSGVRDSTGTITINTSTPHGLSTGDLVFIDDLKPSNTVAYTTGWSDSDPNIIISGYAYGQAVLLPNGNVLFAGGYDGAASKEAFIYNTTTNTWAPASDMNVARYRFQMTLLQNGKVLVQGGVGLNSAELYDYVTDTWTTTGSTPTNRTEAPCVTLKNGKVLLIGGDNTTSALLYDPVTGLWISAASTPVIYDAGAAVLLPDGRVVVGGGRTSFAPSIYNPTIDSWQQSSTAFTSAMGSLDRIQAVYLPIGQSGKVLFTGGADDTIPSYETGCYLYDPSTQVLTVIDSLSIGRRDHGIVVMRDGNVMVMGGEIANDFSDTNSIEILDIHTLTWSNGTSMMQARGGFPVVKLNDNRIMAIGGVDFITIFHSSETYTDYHAVLAGGGINGLFKVISTPDADSFTYSTPDFKISTTLINNQGSVTPIKTPTNSIAGPFVYDMSGVSVTNIETTLTQQLVAANNYTIINVTNSSQFPDAEGYLVFGFGTAISTFPVKYLGRISNTTLLLDSSHVLPYTLPLGTTVTLLHSRGVFEPDEPEKVGSFYLTASSAGRVAASNTIDNLVAFGINLKKTVIYPGDIGLGNAGYPASGSDKLSDKIVVWGSDEIDDEVTEARSE